MKKITLLIMFFVSTLCVKAQVAAYQFSQSTGTYTEITGGTVLGNETSDDQRFVDPAIPLGGTVVTGVGFPIGFNFVFNGVVYDRFAVNNNGWISLGMSSLGATAVNMNTSSAYTPLSTTITSVSDDLVARISPLGRDLGCQVGSTLRFELLGTSPNQVLVVQWKNYEKYVATGDSFDFQIRLHETTNVVEVVYGTFVSNTTSGVFDCGLRAAPAASAVNFNSRTSTTSWTASTPSVTSADKMTIVDTNFPPSGLTFTWTPPTCPGSIGLTTTALTNNSATVTWPIPNPAPASGYEYVVSTSSVAPVTNGTSTGDNFASVSSLTGNTVYYVYVRSNCGSSFGTWVLNGSFRTLCDSVTDFVQTFENYPTGTAFLPDCWSKGASTGNVYNTTGSVAPMSPANRLYMNISTTTNAYAILPPVSNLQADTHRLKFKAYATAASKILNVGYLTNPADVNSFVLLDIYDMPSTAATTAQEFTLIPSAIPVGVTNLAFKLEPGSTTTIYIDDVKWEVNSTCVEPSALTINSLTNNSVNLAWTNGGSETQWEAQYGPTNFTLGTGISVSNITTNPYNLTGLLANTTYQFYVRAVCSGPINSSWAGPFSFKTQCDDNTFVTENFDGLTVSGTTTMPDCWRVAGNGTAYTTTGATAPFSPSNRLYMFASSTAVPATRSYVILPALSNLQANTHRLKFRAYTTAVGRTVDVGYLTDPSNVSSFVSIQIVTLPSTVIANAQDFVVTPVAGSIPAGVKNLVFQNPGFAGGTSTIYIDNVVWEPQPTTVPDCATGVVATPNATCGNFANTITWSATTGADGYNLTIGTTPGGTDVLNNSNLGIVTTYTFVGNFNTTYYYTVVPYNIIGAATGCAELSFTTASTGCYCTPVYTTGKTFGDLIANVVITDTALSNNTGASPVNPAYTYFTGQPNYTASLTTGTNYSVNVTVGTFGTQHVAVWVDYNDNLTFETTERVGFTTTSIGANGTGTFSIVLACNAPVGVHRMRVRDVYNTTGNLIDPCASYGYGETEDYDITIVAANVPAPTGVAAQTFCDTPTPTVASLVATGTAIQWYATETGGTALLSTQALVSGTTYYASQTPTCESLTRLAVTATINAITTTTFAPVSAVCAGATAPVLPLTSTNAITGTWSPETVSTVAAGTTTYTFTPTAGQCATTATLDVTVNALPAAPTANSAQTFCPTTSPTLASLAVTGTGLVWYDAATGGNVLPNTTVLTATTYYVASNDGTCDSDRVAISTTSFCPPEVCLNASFGQYPSSTFVPNSANCDGFTSQTITTCGYGSEYSVVTVTLGQTYVFASSIVTDIITISADGGTTSVTSGVGSLSWVATISGDVRFYTHLTGCASQTTCRTKTVTCGIISTDLPDYVNLQFPSTLTFAQGGSGTVYGQVYEGGLTDVAPNVTGQAPGITAWVGISPAGSNTNPDTWTNWVPATWNSGHVSNNDEYQATIGATLLPGTYYYATRFRLNSGAYVYGGIDSSNNGNFWNGTTFNSGVLTVTPPPAPANDDCSGAYTVTVNNDLNCTSVTAGSLIGATASTTDATACFGTEDDDVWFSFVATATTHQVSMVNITGGTTDLYHSLWTGADCSSLTLVPNTCSDPNVSAPGGLTIGQTYYIRVYSWTGTAGQTSTFSVCVGTLPPPPANDDCSGAIALTAGGVFADFAVTGSNASSTNSNPPAPNCASFNGGDVWYSVTIPASGNLTIETGTGSIADTGMAVYSGTCSALNLVECDDDDSSNGNYSLISLVGRTPGEILYVNVWDYFNDQVGTFQVSAYDASLGNTYFDSANFSYYPNPVKNMLNLAYTQNISSVAVFNLLGQEVVTRVVNANQSQIDMSHLPTGTYLVKVTADNQVKTIKVIKE